MIEATSTTPDPADTDEEEGLGDSLPPALAERYACTVAIAEAFNEMGMPASDAVTAAVALVTAPYDPALMAPAEEPPLN